MFVRTNDLLFPLTHEILLLYVVLLTLVTLVPPSPLPAQLFEHFKFDNPFYYCYFLMLFFGFIRSFKSATSPLTGV